MKKPIYQPSNYDDLLITEEEEPSSSTNQIPPKHTENDRMSRMTNLLEKTTNSRQVDNDGNGLTNFEPIAYPEMTKYSKEQMDTENTNHVSQQLPILKPPKLISEAFGPFRDGKNNLSDYNQSYDAGKNVWKHGGIKTSSQGDEHGIHDDKLWDRLGYIIHLLEQQVNEKTDHILEEYALYLLLGVFVIYVLDSFSRYGRYVRLQVYDFR